MEDNFIGKIRRAIESTPELCARTLCGIGDDAAILGGFPGNLAVTTDLLCDEVDFLVGKDSARNIGRKALAVNLSDLAAMGAVPLAVVVSLLLPQSVDGEENPTARFAEEFYEGMLPLAKMFQVAMAGGDTNSWKGKFAVSVTALGAVSANHALLRSGAHPGDRILVTGPLGGSIFGRQFHFMPRIAEALFLSRNYEIHAAMDISDGLLLDLSRMARESGVGFNLEEGKVPIHPDTLAPPKDARSYPGWEEETPPLAHALTDGEDFELILAVPQEEATRLVSEQPFQAMAHNTEVSNSFLDTMRQICADSQFDLSPALIRSLSQARLVDIGTFAKSDTGMNVIDTAGHARPVSGKTGWTYGF